MDPADLPGAHAMKTTRETAAELAITPAALRQHLAAGNVKPPRRRAGMMFLWTAGEIEAARLALESPGRRRPRYMARALAEGGEAR
jgi:predicted transcriptional regulator